ncbi:hypothetical protein LTR62_002372 [Meristemomyces frigidus]|uniref:Uncharacterized protein n=1 Tax=Meristemomyces frigidus TaxID=1508187 RepID=A0AAN7T8N8_9PEZI|nr:hypothetical protein LTR62_002372 [Meristemomyces frigidus]
MDLSNYLCQNEISHLSQVFEIPLENDPALVFWTGCITIRYVVNKIAQPTSLQNMTSLHKEPKKSTSLATVCERTKQEAVQQKRTEQHIKVEQKQKEMLEKEAAKQAKVEREKKAVKQVRPGKKQAAAQAKKIAKQVKMEQKQKAARKKKAAKQLKVEREQQAAQEKKETSSLVKGVSSVGDEPELDLDAPSLFKTAYSSKQRWR